MCVFSAVVYVYFTSNRVKIVDADINKSATNGHHNLLELLNNHNSMFIEVTFWNGWPLSLHPHH
jgi:hypothetical protein